MAQIFISYSSKDQSYADEVVNYLEKHGYTCFIATRDIAGGEAYDEKIVEQLSNPDTVFVLLFSENSDRSSQVKLELTMAFRNELTILPFRLQNILPIKLDYFLQLSQWIDMDETDRYKTLLARISKLIEPEICYNDDNDRFLVDFFAKYDVSLVPNGVVYNRNFNRYTYVYKPEQEKLMSFLMPSLKYTYGYFKYGRLMLDDKFPCLLWVDAQNCLLVVDVATNNQKEYCVDASLLLPSDEPLKLLLGFDVSAQPYYLHLQHLFVNNCTDHNVNQLQYLVKKSFLAKQGYRLYFPNNNHKLDLDARSELFFQEYLPPDYHRIYDENYDAPTDGILDCNDTGSVYCGNDYKEVMQQNGRSQNVISLGFDNFLEAVLSTVYKRKMLFERAKVYSLDSYNEKRPPLDRVIIFMHQPVFAEHESKLLDYLINNLNCLRYGVHFIQTQSIWTYDSPMPKYFANNRFDVTVAHFLHEHFDDCKDKNVATHLLQKKFNDVIIGKDDGMCSGKWVQSHVVVPSVDCFDSSVLNEPKIQWQKPIVKRRHQECFKFYGILPKMVDFAKQNDQFEYAKIDCYNVHYSSFIKTFQAYLELGVLKKVEGQFVLDQSKYDTFVDDLPSL